MKTSPFNARKALSIAPLLRFSVAALAIFTSGSLAAANPAFETLIVQDADPSGTHQGLTEFRSSGGTLNLKMQAVYATTDVNGPNMPTNPALGTPDQQFIYPRLAYFCQDKTHSVVSFAGPLLRVQPGDKVHIQFTNNLVTQRTNLHFHGMDVSPHSENGAGEFGDFVGLPYVDSISPGNSRIYDFAVPTNQLTGPFWYHAHAHGISEMQVASGLSGAFYVEGSVSSFVTAVQKRFSSITSGKSAVATSANLTLSQIKSTLPQLPHHLLVLKDFWTPGLGPINGPLEQSVNGKVTYTSDNPAAGRPYVIQYGATDQIWEILNQSANSYYILHFSGTNIGNAGFYVLGKDGIPDETGLTASLLDNSLMIPPAGRVTVIVPTDVLNGNSVNVTAQAVNTLGDDYFEVGNEQNQRTTPWNLITMTPTGAPAPAGVTRWDQIQPSFQTGLALTTSVENKIQQLERTHAVDATYVLAEPPGTTAGILPPEPTQFAFYRLADSHGTYVKGPADAYDNYEPPIASLTPGKPQRWIIQNTTGEWHAFHLHQVHFIVEKFSVIRDPVNPLQNTQVPPDNEGNPFYAVNEPPPPGSGKVLGQPFYSGPVDTVSIPDGLQVYITLPLDEGPQIAGKFVMHCHILEHEDGGMMANVIAGTNLGNLGDLATARPPRTIPHLSPNEVAAVKLPQPAPMLDSAGRSVTSDLFRGNEFSLVTFGFTTCQGACPATMSKCIAALGKLKPAEAGRVSPFFVSEDVARDNPKMLSQYGAEYKLSSSWRLLLDTKLAASRAFGARLMVFHKPDGSIYLVHSTTVYLVDRAMRIRAAFDEEDTAEDMSERIEKELEVPNILPPAQVAPVAIAPAPSRS